MLSLAAERRLARTGLVLLVISAAAHVWLVLAEQAPSSPYRLNLLPGPIAQLANEAGWLGLAFLCVSAATGKFVSPRASERIGVLATAGAAIAISALIYGAATGRMGVQIIDPAGDSSAVTYLRWLGETILGGCVLAATYSVFSGAPDHER